MSEPSAPWSVGTWTSPTGLTVEVWAKATVNVWVSPSVPPAERSWFVDDVFPQVVKIINEKPRASHLARWREADEEEEK